MPIIKSAKKRVRTAAKAAIRNSKTKRSLKTALKAFRKSAGTGEKDTTKLHSEVQSNIDKTVKKGLVHKNKAARQKSQLAKAAKAAATTKPVKPAAKKAPAKTTAVKKAETAKVAPAKAAAKKPAATKPAAKAKAPAKKPTTKK